MNADHSVKARGLLLQTAGDMLLLETALYINVRKLLSPDGDGCRIDTSTEGQVEQPQSTTALKDSDIIKDT